MNLISSTPSLPDFDPLPKQLEVLEHLRCEVDYDKGTHEVLLSGSVGSAKSIVLAHLAVTHCLMYGGANFGIGRLALPDLKDTLCRKIKEHLYNSGVDYRYHESTGDFKLPNNSKIQALSWADGNLQKLGSHEFSAFAIEELTENETGDFYDVLLQRVGRLPHIPEKFVISATNPDSPRHWAYKKLIESRSMRVKAFFSNTFDNPYLPKSYIEGLLDRLDPKMARRMVYGEWVEIDQERIYYAYDPQFNFRKVKYEINPNLPVRIHFDFNIGNGKPLSMVVSQFTQKSRDDLGEWHFFNEVIVDGQRTLDCMEEAAARGILDLSRQFIVHGDSSGRHRDTRSIASDYDLIDRYLANFKNKKGERIHHSFAVPKANPPIRERHNVMNSYFLSANGDRRFFVYEDCPTLDEGLRLTSLRNGGQYLEDDRPRYQHCTTAAGYGVHDEWIQIEARRISSGSNSIRM